MRGEDGGFSLLETLVAITILAAVAVAFTTGMTAGWRGISAAEADLRALALARNELERASVEWPLALGSRHGISADGLSYSVQISPTAANAGFFPRTKQSTTYWITVEVQSNGLRRPVRLQTIKAEPVQ